MQWSWRWRTLALGLLVALLGSMGGPAAGTAPLPLVEPAAHAAPAPALAHPEGAQLTPIRGALTDSIGNAGLYIAIEKGYFVEQGLDVDIQRFPGTDAYRPALATGELDFGTMDINSGLFNVMARGIDIRFVADRGSLPPGHGWVGWMVRTDLADQIRAIPDVRGKKVAIGFEGALQHIVVGHTMERVGLTANDVDLTIVPFVETNTALANRAVDATVGVEPFNVIAVNNGWATRWIPADEVMPNGQAVIIVYSQNFTNRRDPATRLMTAYLKGVRDYNTALRRGPNRAEIIDIMTRQSPLKDATSWEREPVTAGPGGVVWPAIDPDGRMNSQSIQQSLEWFTRQRMINGPVDLSRYIDHSFADAAAAQLGPYAR